MLILSRVNKKVRNALRGVLQAYGTEHVKRRLWDSEFLQGRWNCLDDTAGDCVYLFVEKYARQGRILDLGCGSGSTGNELDATTYHSYIGVDVSEVALEKARRRTEENRRQDKNQYFQSDILSYLPTHKFNVILYRDSIYYIPRGRITGMLKRYAEYLEEGGVFLARIVSGGTSKAVVETIESRFDVVEKYISGQPGATVLVFRPRPG